jgi:hypothetical protein
MCIVSIFQSLSLNVRRLVSLQEIMAPIQSTFLSFHNEFHGNSIPSFHISNVNELGFILLTKWSVICTHVPIPFFNICSAWRGWLHYKEIWAQFTQHSIHFVMNFMKTHYNEFTIGKVNTKNEWLNELGLMLLTKWSTYMVCTHVQTPSFNFHHSTPRGRFHYKETWAHFTQHSHSFHGNSL